MGSRREEERNEKIIRGLLKLPPNRRCINCNSVGPQFVCTNFWTFVCLTCSGIHREFTHRVKSVSMAKFSKQEIEALQQGGNQRAREIYLKGWDMEHMRFPSNSNPDKIRNFIRSVYIDMKYAVGSSSDKTPDDTDSMQGRESGLRRPSSYHSYSQSPPYDYQYEERIYGKPAGAFARRQTSDRGLYEGKLARFLHSPDNVHEQANDHVTGESSSRFSDFSVASDPYKYEGRSPNFQDSGRLSCSVVPVRTMSIEAPRSKLQRHSSASLQTELPEGRHPQITSAGGSSGSLGAGNSMPRNSVGSGGLVAGTIEETHPSFHQVPQSASLPPSDNNFAFPGSNNMAQKVSAVSHRNSHTGAVAEHAPSEVGNFQATPPMPLQQTYAAPYQAIDLFASFTEQPSSMPVDARFHGIEATTLATSELQKSAASQHSLLAQQHSSSQFSDQALDSQQTMHPHVQRQSVDSSMAVDLFTNHPPVLSFQQQPSIAPISSNEQWATFGIPQHELHHNNSNVQLHAPIPVNFNEKIEQGVNTPAVQTLPVPQAQPLSYISGMQPLQAASTSESSQSWRSAFEAPAANLPHNSFGPLSNQDVALQMSSVPSASYTGIGISKDLLTRGTSSTNPFDLPYESNFETNSMFMDMSSVHAALPTQHIRADYNATSLQPVYPQNSDPAYVPSGPEVSFMPIFMHAPNLSGSFMPMVTPAPSSQMYSLPPQAPLTPRNPFE